MKLGESEVFSAGEDGVRFSNVGWVQTAMFFTKVCNHHSILSSGENATFAR